MFKNIAVMNSTYTFMQRRLLHSMSEDKAVFSIAPVHIFPSIQVCSPRRGQKKYKRLPSKVKKLFDCCFFILLSSVVTQYLYTDSLTFILSLHVHQQCMLITRVLNNINVHVYIHVYSYNDFKAFKW